MAQRIVYPSHTHRKKPFNRLRKTIVAFVQYVAYSLGCLLIRPLPRRLEVLLGRTIGFLCWALPTRYRKIARANIDIAFGSTMDVRARRRILRKSLLHQGQVLVDYFWFANASEKRLRRYCRFADPIIERWAKEKFPGMLVTAHIGNWELAGRYIAANGRQLWSVFKPIGSKTIQRKLARFRQAQGQRIIPREGAMVGIIRALRAGDVVALLLDQHTELSDGGEYCEFFGLKAAFSTAPEILAKRMKVPILIACAIYDAATDTYACQTHYEFTTEIIESMPIEELKRQVVAKIESMIRANPEQWMWCYPRWKRYLPGEDPSRYPFYAKLDGIAANARIIEE